MNSRWTMTLGVAAVLGLGAVAGACSDDDDPMGPQLGDLAFDSDSVVDLRTLRDTVLVLSNVSDVELGPIEIGNDDVHPTGQTFRCSDMALIITPSTIAALDPGGELPIDVHVETSGATGAVCPAGMYDASVLVSLPSVDDRILAVTVVRFDWDGTPP